MTAGVRHVGTLAVDIPRSRVHVEAALVVVTVDLAAGAVASVLAVLLWVVGALALSAGGVTLAVTSAMSVVVGDWLHAYSRLACAVAPVVSRLSAALAHTRHTVDVHY